MPAAETPGSSAAAGTGIGTGPKDQVAIHSVEEIRSCPLCDSGRITRWCIGTDRALDRRRERFAYSRCGDCRVVFASLRPTEDVIHQAYPAEYAPYQHSAAAGDRPSLWRRIQRTLAKVGHKVVGQPAFQARVNRALKRFGKEHRVLDFGCGAGKFLDKMARRGCGTFGVDFSPREVEAVQGRGHTAWLADDDIWDQLPKASFDLVRMNHVVEHLYHPRHVLGQLRARMRPGGLLHIAVPNPAGLSARLFRARWYGLECPRHIILYPPANLARMLSELGYTDVRVLPEPQAKDLVRSFGYLLEALRLRRRGRVEALLQNGLLLALFAPICRIAARLGGADRYHILANNPETATKQVAPEPLP